MGRVTVSPVGNGEVVLICGGNRCYTDIAASFCRSTKDIDDIISNDYNKNLVKTIIESGHLAATEFDYYLFGIQGYSRVLECQLIRKRMASYMISSGRCEKHGKRPYNVVLPEDILDISVNVPIKDHDGLFFKVSTLDLLTMLSTWYDEGVKMGVPEEDLRYLKPQGTEMRALIGMNAHALMDWFNIRCCMNAQTEIRDLANKMLKLCKQVSPDLFENAGPNCKKLGYCPEGNQNPSCRGKIITKRDAMNLIKNQNFEKAELDVK